MLGDVRVVTFKFNLSLRLAKSVKHDVVVDGNAREAEEMDQGQAAFPPGIVSEFEPISSDVSSRTAGRLPERSRRTTPPIE